jgi:hypothetical protein
MPWSKPWPFLKVSLWLPDQWMKIDDYLMEVDGTIDQYDESLRLGGSHETAAREEYYTKRITQTPWQILMDLWRLDYIVLRGRRSYLNQPPPLVIDAVRAERSMRNFSYDGDHMRHVAGDLWFSVEALESEAYAAPCSQGELLFPAKAMLMLPAPASPGSQGETVEPESDASSSEPEAPSPPVEPELELEPPEEEPEEPPKRRKPGPLPYEKIIIAAFDALPDDLVRNVKSLPSLFPAVLANIPDKVKATADRGLGPQSLRFYLRGPYKERRGRLAAGSV